MAELAANSGSNIKPYAWLKPGVFIGCLLPLALMIVDAARGQLGADPVAIALNRLGLLALITLVASLAATPARLVLGWAWPLRLRRMLGLFAFFYAFLHFTLYLAVDQGFDLSAIVKDVTERKFITVGFAAFVVLVPLAATSPLRVRRMLGPKRWQRLHRLVYLASALAALHFVWRVKRDLTEPTVYAAVIGALLLARVLYRRPRPARPATE
jgi:methionine sulfoxide reductase heme-binding subunit